MKTLPPIFKHPSDRFERFSNIPFFPRIASNIPPNGFQTSLPVSNIPRHFSNLASDNFKHPSDRFQTSLSDLRPSLESPGIIQIEAFFQTSLRFSNIPWVQTSLPSLKFQRSLSLSKIPPVVQRSLSFSNIPPVVPRKFQRPLSFSNIPPVVPRKFQRSLSFSNIPPVVPLPFLEFPQVDSPFGSPAITRADSRI